MRSSARCVALTVSTALYGCPPVPFTNESYGGDAGDSGGGTSGGSTGGSTGGGSTGATTGEAAPETATVVHSFGAYVMAPYLEIEPCVQWTLHNEEAIYVNSVTLSNDGGYHHSNWFAVPEELYPGEDGYWGCGERGGYNEVTAAVQGTVIFAQSTQSRYEVMALPPGVTVKVPPRHKLIAGTHLLNLGSAELRSELRMALEIVHPRDVEVVVAPMHLDYRDLHIPAKRRSRFTSGCGFAGTYEDATKHPLDIKLYYVLPHYHYLGETFKLEILGGPRDGEVLFSLDGFNGDANGKAFDPPVDLSGASGLRFGCGYNNWLDKDIGYGIGDQEMCSMLGLADSRVMIEARIPDGSAVVGEEGDVQLNEGECDNFAVFKNPAQSPPTAAEREGPFYVPPSDPGDVDLEPTKPCVDSDLAAAPHEPVTLTSVRDAIFTPSCSFSSCHDPSTPAAGLDLRTAEGLRERLLGHAVTANTPLKLIEPGEPDASWMAQLVQRCEPRDADGQVVRHMPFNAPTLLSDDLVAKLRAWIAAGAPDD